MLTVSDVKRLAEHSGNACVVAIATDRGSGRVDFATWGLAAEDKVYADGLAEVVRRGLGHTPVPMIEDYKLQAAHLKVLYDRLRKLRKGLATPQDRDSLAAFVDEVRQLLEATPVKFSPPTYTVYNALHADLGKKHKVMQLVNASESDIVLTRLGLAVKNWDDLKKWIDTEPMPGESWRDEEFTVLVVRNPDF